ncbi:MAG: leucine-rich repeat domain-containing protein [Bacteroidaceae bacterium]|nr:leucine-rich repeat domain-containing protein [Bacteroidaceae bacterium]
MFHGAGLTRTYIHKDVEHIGEHAFCSCPITYYKVDVENQYYADVDGVLFTKDHHKLLKFPQERKESSYTVPNEVKALGACAFKKCQLAEILLNDDLELLEDQQTFSGCENLERIVIPQGVKSIPRYAFANCIKLNMVLLPDCLSEIGDNAFDGCTNLTEIHIHNENPDIIKASFNENDVEHITLYVPVGTGYAYRHHPEFKKFKEVKIERRKN